MAEVFLSYAHLDNLDPENWVNLFHDKLEKRLSVIRGERVKIWKDNYDREGNELEQSIDSALIKTELLIALVSPAYLKREWCAKERKKFIEHTALRDSPIKNPLERIFPVVKLAPSELDENYKQSLPKELKSQVYFRFYGWDENRNPKTLEFPDRAFDTSLNDLANKVKHELDRIRRTPEDTKIVFLAQTANDLMPFREDILRELKARGFEVFPKTPLADDAEELEQELAVFLNQSCLSIHLLSMRHGLIVPGTTASLSQFQYEQAASKKTNMITWIDTKKSSEKPMDSFLENVRKNVNQNNDIIEGTSQEDFKIEIFETLKRL